MTATAPYRSAQLASGRHRVRLTPPAGWEPLDEVDPLVRSWAAPLDGVSPVRSTLQVLVASAAPSSIVELAARHRAELPAQLATPRVIDHGVVALADRDASHVVALTHDPHTGGCVTIEQWALAVGRWTVIITARLCSADYPALLHDLREALDTLEFDGA